MQEAQRKEKSAFQDIHIRFNRLQESTKHTLLQEKKEKVRYSDLDAVKQENLTVHSFISDKMSML